MLDWADQQSSHTCQTVLWNRLDSEACFECQLPPCINSGTASTHSVAAAAAIVSRPFRWRDWVRSREDAELRCTLTIFLWARSLSKAPSAAVVAPPSCHPHNTTARNFESDRSQKSWAVTVNQQDFVKTLFEESNQLYCHVGKQEIVQSSSNNDNNKQ